jgi:hypothetical protein
VRLRPCCSSGSAGGLNVGLDLGVVLFVLVSRPIVCHKATLCLQIPIKLYSQEAPETAKLITELAQTGCTGCQFYRNEAKPWVR